MTEEDIERWSYDKTDVALTNVRHLYNVFQIFQERKDILTHDFHQCGMETFNTIVLVFSVLAFSNLATCTCLPYLRFPAPGTYNFRTCVFSAASVIYYSVYCLVLLSY